MKMPTLLTGNVFVLMVKVLIIKVIANNVMSLGALHALMEMKTFVLSAMMVMLMEKMENANAKRKQKRSILMDIVQLVNLLDANLVLQTILQFV